MKLINSYLVSEMSQYCILFSYREHAIIQSYNANLASEDLLAKT